MEPAASMHTTHRVNRAYKATRVPCNGSQWFPHPLPLRPRYIFHKKCMLLFCIHFTKSLTKVEFTNIREVWAGLICYTRLYIIASTSPVLINACRSNIVTGYSTAGTVENIQTGKMQKAHQR
jgi:hypothetical protein